MPGPGKGPGTLELLTLTTLCLEQERKMLQIGSTNKLVYTSPSLKSVKQFPINPRKGMTSYSWFCVPWKMEGGTSLAKESLG